MSTIVTRSGKGSPLTHVEVDANFTNLNSDKYQEGSAIGATTPAAGTFTTLTGGGGSANYFQTQGSATTKAVEVKALGSDTNIAFVIDSKGTGAIDLAAGSSGVNISNGGTVTATTLTAQGSGYSSAPTVAITAPTTAGGVQATANAVMGGTGTITVTNGGSGYTVNDVLTFVGGTGSAESVTVTAVSAGVITAVTFRFTGQYTVVPTNPVSVTGGTGSGATFTCTWKVLSLSITNAGSGYVEQPTVSFSGGGGSGAAAYATVGSIPTIKTVGSALSFTTPSGEQFRVRDNTTTAVNYGTIKGSGTGSTVDFGVDGADGGITLALKSKGSGGIFMYTAGGNNAQLGVPHTANAVNYVQVTGAATGGVPTISAQGSDSTVALGFASKGAKDIVFWTNSNNRQFNITHTATAVNYLSVTGAIATAAPVLSSQGSDTNIDLALTPKGTGRVKFGTYTANMALTVQGYIEILDSGGTVRKLAVIA